MDVVRSKSGSRIRKRLPGVEDVVFDVDVDEDVDAVVEANVAGMLCRDVVW